MQVNGCASIALKNERHSGKGAPVVAISLSLRGRNEIDELLFAVHVELPIDIAPVGDGRSFRYYQFFLNAREGIALRKNDENLEFSRGLGRIRGRCSCISIRKNGRDGSRRHRFGGRRSGC